MGGLSLITPYGQIESRDRTTNAAHTTNVRPAMWFPPHMYATWQLNDDWWLGFGVFSRFGLGNQYPSNWSGRYAIYNVGLQTFSANPVVAYKVNDWLSLAVGVELTYLSIFLEKKVDLGGTPFRADNDMNMEGDSWGVGMNAAAHIRVKEQWSAGLTQRSQMTHHVTGKTKFARQDNALGPWPELRDANANAKVQLPDSAALAVMWKPLPNLSVEVGTTWTRWSTYNELNIYPEKAPHSHNPKSFRDGWNFNASVEYQALDWLALRLGYWHETPVVNKTYSDYLLPTNGRDGLMAGLGFKWHNWTLDLAYAHLWIYPLSYGESAAREAKRNPPGGVWPGTSKNTHADMFSVSLGYSF
jgi:long-chain fatty acid transport protein